MDKHFKEKGEAVKGDAEGEEGNGKFNSEPSGKRGQEDKVSASGSTSCATQVGGVDDTCEAHSECVPFSQEVKPPILETTEGGKPSEVVYNCQIHAKCT